MLYVLFKYFDTIESIRQYISLPKIIEAKRFKLLFIPMGAGILSMTKPNYSSMTRAELKNYLLHNRHDEEGWTVFFEKLNQLDRSHSYPPPWKTNSGEFEAILQEKTGYQGDLPLPDPVDFKELNL